jgi:opacity protein-like surface antigen
MRSLAVAAVAALFLVAATAVRAQEARPGPYGGILFSQLSYEQSGASSASLTNLGGVLGQVLSPHFALEGRFGLGLNDDRINVGAVAVDVDLDYYVSGLLKGILPLAPRFGIYAVAGFTIGKFSASNGAAYLNKWESDFSYGAGAEFGFAQSMSLALEWQRMFEGSGYNLDAVSVALNFRF